MAQCYLEAAESRWALDGHFVQGHSEHGNNIIIII